MRAQALLEKAPRPRLERMLPDEVHGWAPSGSDQLYGPDNLFDLIDGGAEAYRALNVRSVLSRTYSRKDSAEILVDLFDMGSSADAYGAYHIDVRDQRDPGIGMEAELQGGALFFWMHRYFVSIVPLATDPTVEKAVLHLGLLIASSISGASHIPTVVGRLPRQAADQSQIFYFHTYESLVHRVALAPKDDLALDPSCEGALAPLLDEPPAEVEDVGPRGVLMVIRYPTARRASAGLAGLVSRGLSGPPKQIPVERPRGRWSGARRRGRLLMVALWAWSPARVQELLANMERPGTTERRGKGS